MSQGEYRCHACYAFAAVGALESANAIQNGNLVQLSEQQVLDCSRELNADDNTVEVL